MNKIVEYTKIYKTVWLLPVDISYISGVLATLKNVADFDVEHSKYDIVNAGLDYCVFAFNGDDTSKTVLKNALNMEFYGDDYAVGLKLSASKK